MSKILIIRFSALGDVAMTIPVIHSLATQYPMHEITVLSTSSLKSLFTHLPKNVRFIGADLKGIHKGINGLLRLYNELKKYQFDFVADFHNVLRSNFLRFLFKLNGVKTAKIDKGRDEKKKLARKIDKKLVQLDTSFVRYQKVLEKLGFVFELQFVSLLNNTQQLTQEVPGYEKNDDLKWIGIAPFAKHKGKIYPMHLQEIVIAHFTKDSRVKLFIFGGGKAENEIIENWMQKYGNIHSLVGKMDMSQELVLMSQLDVMLSMDSANMHLASLVATPVVSIWGATHPFAGFMGWNQSGNNAIQLDMACRPCSIYGQIPCFREDYACMNNISPTSIIEKIESIIHNKSAR